MNSYSDINQWLDDMGISDRSAGDPWTMTRRSRMALSGSSFSPAVTADLGAPAQELTSEMQAAVQIEKADAVVTSPTGSAKSGSTNSSGSSGILGGLLNLFPLASAVGKLFGLGGSSSPPPLTPYIEPPSVNFQGAVSSGLSESTAGSLPGSGARVSRDQALSTAFAPGIDSLTYGANGLPKTTTQLSSQVADDVVGLTSSNFVPQVERSSAPLSSEMSAALSAGGETNPGMGAAGGAANSTGQSILVQVQAMDSQSFLDHSSDIAQAVRHAMLNMHSVNDVIANL